MPSRGMVMLDMMFGMASLSIRLFIRSMALRVSPGMCKNIISSRMGQEGLCKKGLRRTVGRRDCGGVPPAFGKVFETSTGKMLGGRLAEMPGA